MRKFSKLLPAVAVVVWAAHAGATCGSAVCDMSAKLVSVEPPSTCIDVRVYADDCDCAVGVSLTNSCENAASLSDFQFAGSWMDSSQTNAVTSVPPDDEVSLLGYLETTGEASESFVVTDAEGDHRITVQANVTEFSDGCLCVVTGPRRASLWALLVPGIGVALLALRRRRSWPS